MKTLFNVCALTLLSAILLASGGEDKQELKVLTDESEIIWTGKKVGGEHYGTIQLKSGTLQMEKGKLSSAGVVVDMTTIVDKDIKKDGMRAKLEGHLKSDDFFGVEKYPESTFKLTKVEKIKDGKFNVTGDLTIKGKTHPISFPAEVNKEGNKYVATADLVFDRSKYDVRYGSKSFFDDLGDNMIYDDVELSVRLVAQ
ncbi:MAG: YceI family protein [Bacteroidetes bacterium]|jgi:polyisoprenoid-binding protein YceI|nr:YceI family protein [Bacteroidota bacterium]